MSPRSRATALVDGLRLHRAGRLREAEQAYRAAVARNRRDPVGWSNLGSVLAAQGRPAEAADAYRQALRARPADADLLTALAGVLVAAGALKEAEEVARKALATRPRAAHLWAGLGTVLARQGRPSDAIDAYKRSLELAPEQTGVRLALGELLISSGFYPQGCVEMQKAAELEPGNLAIRLAVGNAHLGRQNPDAAYEAFKVAAAIAPNDQMPQAALGVVLAMQGSPAAAEALYRRAGELGNPGGNAFRAATVLPAIYSSVDDIRDWRQRYSRRVDELMTAELHLADPIVDVGLTSFGLAYQGFDDRALQEKLAQAYLKACPSLAWKAPSRRPSKGRVRVAFLSCNLRTHTIGKVNRGIIGHLDRERFEVTVILGPQQDRLTEEIRRSADHHTTLYGSLAQMREQVAATQPDILFYPDIGMEPISYFLAFARLAPVQVVTWGHPTTTGIPAIDHYVSSGLVESEDADSLYSESLVRLPRIPSYYYRPTISEALPGRSRLSFEDDWRVYCVVQSLFKVHPEFDSLVGEILRRDPHGRVVFVDGPTQYWSEQLNSRLERTIPDVADRVLFLPRLSEFDYFNLLVGADALLDTIHFGGGSTTYESFALGSPVVTWPGRMARSRVTEAHYVRMGMEDLVAHSAAEYVETALRLANDRGWREEQRRRIMESSDAIFEDLEAVRSLERFFDGAIAGAMDGPGGDRS